MDYSRIDYFWWLIIGGACVLMAFILYWLRKRKLRNIAHQAKEDPIKLTRQNILALNPSKVFDRKAQEDYYYQLNISFRYFMELVYKLPATDRTFFELRKLLRKKLTLDTGIVETIICFFEKSEYIKFAERESTRDEAKLDKKKVLQWMDEMEFSKLEALEKKKTGEIIVNGEADATRL